jgi:hypothetical protein
MSKMAEAPPYSPRIRQLADHHAAEGLGGVLDQGANHGDRTHEPGQGHGNELHRNRCPGAVQNVLAGGLAPFERRRGAARKDGQGLLLQGFGAAAHDQLQVSDDFERFAGERPGDDRLLTEQETQEQPVAVGDGVGHVGRDECGALGGDILQTAHEPGVPDVVGGGGPPDLPGRVVENVDRRRTGGEVDVVAREVVGLISEHIEQIE